MRAVDRATPFSEAELRDLWARGVRSVLAYIGGRNNGGRTWRPVHVELARNLGFTVQGIYVGENVCHGCARPDWSRAERDADEAVALAEAWGIGTVYLDVEYATYAQYPNESVVYTRRWLERAKGRVDVGVYGPRGLLEKLQDTDAILWLASWTHREPASPPFRLPCGWQWTNRYLGRNLDASVFWGVTERVGSYHIGGGFLRLWQDVGHGVGATMRLMLLGYPISEEFREGGRVVQYFERAVLEHHPENAPPFDVLLARLGAERYAARYGGQK